MLIGSFYIKVAVSQNFHNLYTSDLHRTTDKLFLHFFYIIYKKILITILRWQWLDRADTSVSIYTGCLVSPAVRYIPMKVQDYVSWLLRARSHYVMSSYSNMNTDSTTIVTVLQSCKYHNITQPTSVPH